VKFCQSGLFLLCQFARPTGRSDAPPRLLKLMLAQGIP